MKQLRCYFAVALLMSSAAQAQDWHYNGFINQTLINTSDNFMFGSTDDNLSLDYRELALIVGGPVLPQVDFSSQLLSRKAGVADDGTPRIDYAFFSWRFFENISFTQGARIGRLKAPIGFFNDSRDSPFTRIGVFLPQSIYVDRIRNFIMRADEVMYFGEWRAEKWLLNWKLAYGKNSPDKEEMDDFFHKPESLALSFESSNVWHFQLLADYDEGRMRFGYSEFDSPSKFALNNFQGLGEISSEGDSHWRVASFEYNDVSWSFTAEYSRAVVKYNGFSPDLTDPNYKDYPEAAYAQLMWRFTSSQSIFIRKEQNYLNRNDADGEHYALFPIAEMANLIAADRYGFSNVIGWSYVPNPSWLIRLDLSKNTGLLFMTERDAPAGYQSKLHWNMAALSVAWRF